MSGGFRARDKGALGERKKRGTPRQQQERTRGAEKLGRRCMPSVEPLRDLGHKHSSRPHGVYTPDSLHRPEGQMAGVPVERATGSRPLWCLFVPPERDAMRDAFFAVPFR